LLINLTIYLFRAKPEMLSWSVGCYSKHCANTRICHCLYYICCHSNIKCSFAIV